MAGEDAQRATGSARSRVSGGSQVGCRRRTARPGFRATGHPQYRPPVRGRTSVGVGRTGGGGRASAAAAAGPRRAAGGRTIVVVGDGGRARGLPPGGVYDGNGEGGDAALDDAKGAASSV